MTNTFSLPDLLKTTLELGGSDLHLSMGSPPQVRVDGHLKRLEMPELTPDSIKSLCYSVLTDVQKKKFEETWELDLAFGLRGVGRFRCNVFNQKGAVGAVFRLIPEKIRSLEELNLPPVLAELADRPRGLVLVTGPTGSGKSTTLAAMIDRINRNQPVHIVTVEDPLEFIHDDHMALINQRELDQDTLSFANALKYVLRQDPDVILVGEMRDLDTIHLAITAAETGHLVFATLHTVDAVQTVDRIVNTFPADKQSHIRTMLSTSLRGVISQQLLPTKGKPGRVAALEILINTAAVANLIRQGKLDQLETAMQSGGATGMRTMDSALMELVEKKFVSGREAYQQANNKSKFQAIKDDA